MRKAIQWFAGLVLAGLSGSAQATVYKLDFTITPPFYVSGDSADPFGTSMSQALYGSITIDDSRALFQQFIGLDYVTGSRTWTLADVQAPSAATFAGGQVTWFDLDLNGYGNYVNAYGSAGIRDNTTGKGIACINCVSFTSSVVSSGVPEPTTWAMMIVGFGLVGGAMRREGQRKAIRYSFG